MVEGCRAHPRCLRLSSGFATRGRSAPPRNRPYASRAGLVKVIVDAARHLLRDAGNGEKIVDWINEIYGAGPPAEFLDWAKALRADWEKQAGIVASYREAAGITDPAQAIGPDGSLARTLGRIAADTARLWRFEPGRQDGRAVATVMTIQFKFGPVKIR